MKKSIIKFLAILVFSSNLGFSTNIPTQIRAFYERRPDRSVSDDFNAKRENFAFDTTKWHFRQPNAGRVGLEASYEYVQEKSGILYCYGKKATRKAGAIISNKYFQHGWYTFKWRTTGMPADKRNPWHPSIWGAAGNAKKEAVPNSVGKGDSWTEIDIVEYSTWNPNSTYWDSDSPTYIWVDSLKKRVKVNDSDGRAFKWQKAVMSDGVKDAYNGEVIGLPKDGQWQIIGMEYHKDYLQLWRKDGKKWVKIGRTINFTDDDTPPSISTVPRKAMKPLFWYLGNLFLPHGKTPIQEDDIVDSSLEIDYFYFYPLRKNL